MVICTVHCRTRSDGTPHYLKRRSDGSYILATGGYPAYRGAVPVPCEEATLFPSHEAAQQAIGRVLVDHGHLIDVGDWDITDVSIGPITSTTVGRVCVDLYRVGDRYALRTNGQITEFDTLTAAVDAYQSQVRFHIIAKEKLL